MQTRTRTPLLPLLLGERRVPHHGATEDLVQLPEAEVYEVTCRKAYGLASAVLREWKEETKSQLQEYRH